MRHLHQTHLHYIKIPVLLFYIVELFSQSLIELNVLSDVLLIGNSKKYLTLEQIHLEKEEFNKSLAFVGKKKVGL